MNGRIECQGYCWMTKDGIEVWRCDQTECHFWTFFFAPGEKKITSCFA